MTTEFVLLLTQMQPKLYGYILKRLGNREAALDVLQEVNLGLCKKSSEFQKGTNFEAWAYSFARYEILAQHQKQARDRHVFPPDLLPELDTIDHQLFPLEAGSIEDALSDCVAELPQKSRSIIYRRYSERVSVRTIAAEMGRTANALSCWLHRIREQLSKCVEEKISKDGCDG